MPAYSGVTTKLRSGDLVRICPWVTVDHVKRYWDTVNPDMLRLYIGCRLRVDRLDDDGTYGMWARVHPVRPQDGSGVFWVKTCLLTLASDPQLI